MATIKVKVTQDHIEQGATCDSTCCPIALAIREMGYHEACVYPRSVEFGPGNDGHALPSQARDFVLAFDSESGDAHPFEFDLDIPDSIQPQPLEGSADA